MLTRNRDEVDRSPMAKGEQGCGWGEKHNSYGNRSSQHMSYYLSTHVMFILYYISTHVSFTC